MSFFKSKSNFRRVLTLYLLARSFDSLMKTVNSDKVAKIPNSAIITLIYVVMVNFISFQIVFNPNIAGKSFTAMFDKLASPIGNDTIMFKHIVPLRAARMYGK